VGKEGRCGQRATEQTNKFASPEAQDWALYRVNLAHWTGPADVRFGSKADISTSRRDVRFTPKSGHWLSGS
jgi:hypothetical protein